MSDAPKKTYEELKALTDPGPRAGTLWVHPVFGLNPYFGD